MTEVKVKTVCLVGSSRFKDRFHEIGERLEKAGTLVLMMAFFQHADKRQVSISERKMLHVVDRARLALADEVWVVNGERLWCDGCKEWKDVGHFNYRIGMVYYTCELGKCQRKLERRPYLGKDTMRELDHARILGITVRWLNPPTSNDLPFSYAAVELGEIPELDKNHQANEV